MRNNVKGHAAITGIRQQTTLFENPEITAMAAICEILQELPDDDARLRVMRWSFGRFSSEFKRPAAEPEAQAQTQTQTPAPPSPSTDATRAPLTLVAADSRVSRQPAAGDDASALDVRTVLAVAPDLIADKTGDDADFASQISELHDLFPAQSKAKGAVDWLSTLNL